MARAELITEIVKTPRGVQLTLSNNEAEALVSVLRKIGGAPDDTRRGFTQAVLQALRDAGVPTGPSNDLDGALNFGILPVNDPLRAELTSRLT
jgi:hypothetical protein